MNETQTSQLTTLEAVEALVASGMREQDAVLEAAPCQRRDRPVYHPSDGTRYYRDGRNPHHVECPFTWECPG